MPLGLLKALFQTGFPYPLLGSYPSPNTKASDFCFYVSSVSLMFRSAQVLARLWAIVCWQTQALAAKTLLLYIAPRVGVEFHHSKTFGQIGESESEELRVDIFFRVGSFLNCAAANAGAKRESPS